MSGQEPSSRAPAGKMPSVSTPPLVLHCEDMEAAGALPLMAEIHEVLQRAWRDIQDGRTSGGKTVLSLPEAEFWQNADFGPQRLSFVGERLGWKLSCLYGVNPHYAGVKVIGANAFNRRQGLARSTSTFILMDKWTMRPLAIMDATALSAARTGHYATKILQLALSHKDAIRLFLFGAGPVASAVLQSLAHGNAERITRVYVRSRSVSSAEALQRQLACLLPLDIVPVADNRALAQCDFVVTASNASGPVFADDELARDAVCLHLGGDEVPAATLRRVLRQGHVGCDDLATVSRRNSQSLALLFSRTGTSLEAVGPALGIFEFSKAEPGGLEPGSPVSVTCVGLPVLDLYVAASAYEKYRARRAAVSHPAVLTTGPDRGEEMVQP